MGRLIHEARWRYGFLWRWLPLLLLSFSLVALKFVRVKMLRSITRASFR